MTLKLEIQLPSDTPKEADQQTMGALSELYESMVTVDPGAHISVEYTKEIVDRKGIRGRKQVWCPRDEITLVRMLSRRAESILIDGVLF